MKNDTKQLLLTDTNRKFSFENPIAKLSNNIKFFRRTLVL
jgi:hypothetical protein